MSRIFAVLVPLTLAAIAPAQKVTLRLNPSAGKVYLYDFAMEMKQTAPEFNTAMKQNSTLTLKVLSNTNGQIVLESDSGKVKVQVPKDDPMISYVPELEKTSSDVKSTISLDSRGQNMTIKLPDGGNAMLQSMTQGMNGASMGFYALPSGPVGVGSTWSSTFDMAKMMSSAVGSAKPADKPVITGGKIPVQFRLIQFVKRGGKTLAKINIAMAGSMSLKGAGAGASKGSMDISLSSKGWTLVDVATGMTVEADTTSVNKTSFGGISMAQNIRNTLKLKG